MAWIDEIKKALKANPGKSVAEVIPIAKKTYAASKKDASSSDIVKEGVATVSKATKKIMPKKAKKSKRAKKSRKAKKSKRTRRSKNNGKRRGKKSKRGGGCGCDNVPASL